MPVAITEIVRPNGVENEAWGTAADPAKIDDPIESPEAPDGEFVAPSGLGFQEQIFAFPPPINRFESVSAIEVFVYGRPIIFAGEIVACRVRVESIWSPVQEIDPFAGPKWFSLSFEGEWSRPCLEGLAMGIRQSGGFSLILVDAIYLRLTGTPTLLDLGDELATVVDGLQSVNHVSASGQLLATASSAKRLAVTAREAAPSAGRVRQGDVKWHLPAGELTGAPNPGDQIVDCKTTRWTILRVEAILDLSQYVCWCRDLVIAEGLDQVITLQRAIWTKGNTGEASATWEDWRTGMRARIQPLATQVELAHDLKHSRATHRIYLAEALPIDHNTRVVGPDGALYHVMRYEAVERIDQLPVIEAQRSPWPSI